MSNQEINRKIAVIFATDLVGNSKHMEEDENAILLGLRECNKIIEASMLGIYAYVSFDKNNKKEAKNILLKAIKKGLTKKLLVRQIGVNKAETFIKKLKPLGNID